MCAECDLLGFFGVCDGINDCVAAGFVWDLEFNHS